MSLIQNYQSLHYSGHDHSGRGGGLVIRVNQKGYQKLAHEKTTDLLCQLKDGYQFLAKLLGLLEALSKQNDLSNEVIIWL